MRISDWLKVEGRSSRQPPPPLSCGQTVENAARRMERFGVRLLPICRNDGTIAGVIGERDIVVKVVARSRAPELCTVDEVMTTRYLSCHVDQGIDELLRLFADSSADCALLLARDGKLAATVERSELPVQPTRLSFRHLPPGRDRPPVENVPNSP